MKHQITVREYARLTTESCLPSLDQATVTPSAFDWLCRMSEGMKKNGAPLIQVGGRQWLTLDNYVGVIETPCGTRLEILPKHADGDVDLHTLRKLLIRMLSRSLNITPQPWGPTDLFAFKHPISEWLMRYFLQNLDSLIKRGIRFDYKRIEEVSRYLRGQLDIAKQLRQPAGRQHLLHIRHDIFSSDRAENRLIKTALERVRKCVRESNNWRLAQQLAFYLDEISPSTDIEKDFEEWRHDRLMAHYQPIKSICELILSGMTPLTQIGEWRGLSLLFPMEKIFEYYVATTLASQLNAGWTLSFQARSEYLCTHLDRKWFALNPDMAIRSKEGMVILDTKWKLLDAEASNTKDKYELSQSDFYQLFAYGQKYLQGRGELFLIYPKTTAFPHPLPPFHFSDELRLWVVPFDLESERLVVGPWITVAPWLARDIAQAA